MKLRKPLLAVILLAISAAPSAAQNNTGAGGGGLIATAPINMFKSAGPNTHQQLTITSGAVVALTVPPTATIAEFTVETASIRMLDDGTNPTTTLGNLWTIGPAVYGGSLVQLQAMRFIAVSGSATLDVLYYTNN
jgi:hypothetical protein